MIAKQQRQGMIVTAMSSNPSCLLLRSGLAILLFAFSTRTIEGQELPNPLYERNQFNTTESFRTNVCDRQKAFANKEIALADALAGLELRIILGENQFYRPNPETGGLDEDYPGLQVILMDELARRGKFTWRNSFATFAEVPIEGRTYTELLLWTTQYYDISLTYWANTLTRNALGVSFPEGWFDSSIILVGKKPSDTNSKFDAFLWLQPFNDAVWLLIVASLIASGLIYWMLDWFDHKSDGGKLHAESPTHSVFLTAVTFTGHFEFHPRTNASRLFTISLTFWALIVGSAYTANLASFLVVNNTPKLEIESVDDAVRRRAPMCVHDSTPNDELISSAYPNALLVRKKTEKELFLGVRDGDCAVAVATSSAWANYWEHIRSVNGNCDMEWVGRTYRHMPAGFATYSDSGSLCTSLIRDVLNVHMLQMKEDGFLEDAWNDYVERISDLDCSAADGDTAFLEDADDQQLDLESMGGVFLFHYGLTFLAVVLAVLKSFGKEAKKKKALKKFRETDSEDGPSNVWEEKPSDFFSEDSEAHMQQMRSEIRQLGRQQYNQNKEMKSQISRIAELLLEQSPDASGAAPVDSTSLMVGRLKNS